MVIDILINIIIYLSIGVLAGLMAGILGLGGGLVVVPGLLFVFNYNGIVPEHLAMHVATSTSLATMFFTAFAAVRMHYNNGALFSFYKRLWVGLCLGALGGALLSLHLPATWLRILFGLFLLAIAYKLFININIEYKVKSPRWFLDQAISILIGFVSSLLGIGGGTMVIPYLLYNGVPIRETAPISGLCTMTIALVGAIVVMFVAKEPGMPSYSTGYIYWPAVLWVVIPSYIFTPIGVRLTYRLPIIYLKYIFIILMSLVGLSLIFI